MARGIVAQYIREGRIRERTRGGRNNVLADDEMRQRLEDIINENCVVTLSQMNGELSGRLPAKPLIHDQAAAQSLEGMLFRVKLVRPVSVFYDGAPANRNPAIPATNTELEMLLAYSPFLNRVELATGSLKAVIKRGVSRPEIQTRMDDKAEVRCLGIQSGEIRTQLLPDAPQRCIGFITAAKANEWFRFMQTYLPRCLNGEDIEG